MKWLIAQSAWNAINAIDTALASSFNSPNTVLIGTKVGDWSNTVSCKSYAAVQAQGTGSVVLVDYEHWEDTPAPEKTDPLSFYRKSGQCLHSRRQLHLAAPANDLILDMPGYSGTNGSIYDQFLSNFYPGAIAAEADLYDIQAQGLQPYLQRYSDYVRESVEQARANNPYVVLYAGITTRNNPPAQQIVHAYGAGVSEGVDGFWVNIPGGTSAAPMVAALNSVV